jgi:hypothetical protein
MPLNPPNIPACATGRLAVVAAAGEAVLAGVLAGLVAAGLDAGVAGREDEPPLLGSLIADATNDAGAFGAGDSALTTGKAAAQVLAPTMPSTTNPFSF